MKKLIPILIIILTSMGILSCKKFVTVDPPDNKLINATVFEKDATATAAVSYIYFDLMASGQFAQGYEGISHLAGLSADELKTHSREADLRQFYINGLKPDNFFVETIWACSYRNIYRANVAIEAIPVSKGLSAGTAKQLMGESLFMRAFFYFYLTNLFGEVPLALTTDFEKNRQLPNANVDKIYAQILSDLTAAQNLMGSSYLSGTNQSQSERVRPNKAVATALLSRVYLYNRDWLNAEIQSSVLINDDSYHLEDLDRVFLLDSKEAIWQLQPAGNKSYTLEGNNFILNEDFNNSFDRTASISEDLLSEFEVGDLRKSEWVGYYNSVPFVHKYKSNANVLERSENLMVLRLSEQYLIRAEARAMQGKTEGPGSATEDLNTVRDRANLDPINVATSTALLSAIEKERRIELFAEWGNRWLDIKRLRRQNTTISRAEEILSIHTPIKGGSWNIESLYFPIPSSELLMNRNLKQNAGYGN